MIPRLHVATLVGITVALWAAVLLASGIGMSSDFLRPFSLVVGAVSLFVVAFDQWLWRLAFLRPWFHKRPDLRGTWHGTLRSEWIDPESQAPLPPRTVYLSITQTYSVLSLRLLTGEAASDSVAASISDRPSGVPVVYSVYESVPDLVVRSRSPIHFGGMRLEIYDNGERMEGHYWTDRDTKGDLTLKRLSKSSALDYESAARAVVRTD